MTTGNGDLAQGISTHRRLRFPQRHNATPPYWTTHCSDTTLTSHDFSLFSFKTNTKGSRFKSAPFLYGLQKLVILLAKIWESLPATKDLQAFASCLSLLSTPTSARTLSLWADLFFLPASIVAVKSPGAALHKACRWPQEGNGMGELRSKGWQTSTLASFLVYNVGGRAPPGDDKLNIIPNS